tara:strand:+ start:766 stop:1353 length:588 start_codon:yes stop_codon:yes gene_type:complete
MAYFLGRDVDVFISSEATNGVMVNSGTSAITVGTAAGAGTVQFAGPLASGTNTTCRQSDVTGVDLSIGAVDEDITYFGFRSITKAEIKKETTLTLTRKSSNNVWDSVFNNDARWGVNGSALYEGLEEPTKTTGYRIHVQLKSGHEVFTIRGACVSAHSKTLNADGTTEETMEFMSYITPKVSSSATLTALNDAEL